MKYLTPYPCDRVTGVGGLPVSTAVCVCVAVVFALLARAACSTPALAQQPVAEPHTGLINTAGAAFNVATGKSYVVDSDGDSVAVMNDHNDIQRSVKTGSHPVSIA